MSQAVDAFVRSWPFEPWVVGPLLLTGAVYLRGWLALRRRDPRRWTGGRLAAFLCGLGAVFLALASPVETFAPLLLPVHMAQHLLLMMAAPPLLWLGWPLLPLLRGLPQPIRVYWAAPLFRARPLRRAFAFLTHPGPALALFIAATWGWHAPAAYELALRSEVWHVVQHATFLLTGMLFWYPVVRPYPARPRWSPWLLVPYLIVADVQNTALSALLTFSREVIYPYYLEMPRLAGTPREDQAAAGVLMWVPGSLAFMVPLCCIGLRLLYGRDGVTRRRGDGATKPSTALGRLSLPLVTSSPRHPVTPSPRLTAILRWRYGRLVMQVPLLLLAALVIYDGFCGPEVSAMNLAGVLPWVHWRGVLVLVLLVAGNFFCMACPFLLPRTAARKVLGAMGIPHAMLPWPRWLRGKWLAIGLLAVFLWAYEAFALWDSPWLTAWLAVGYFAAPLFIDTVFRGAAFCKYVCPVGQFNFVQSLVSPLEIRARDLSVCAACQTKDCIRGSPPHPRPLSPEYGGEGSRVGCELHLFLPRKAGNMDCTFCLDCARACPHGNVTIAPMVPGSELWHDRQRSGLGRFSKRPDLAALIVLLAFGAFANAAGMVAPVVALRDRLSAALGQTTPLLAVSLGYVAALAVAPVLLVGMAAACSRQWGRERGGLVAVATRYAFALVPLGFAMWLAHYSFHFFTSYEGVIPAAQRLAGEWGWPGLGEPHWACACCLPPARWLVRAEIFFLDLGLLLSLYTAWRVAEGRPGGGPRALGRFAPWAVLLVGLFALGVWVLLQPMEMRGTMGMAG